MYIASYPRIVRQAVESQTWPHPSSQETMILFDDVVHVLARSSFALFREQLLPLQIVHYADVGRVPVDVNHLWTRDVLRAQHLPEVIICGVAYCQSLPVAWKGVTWGLVEGFVKWLLVEGYSVASVNNRLSAVRVYVRLATKAGVISSEEHALIREVRGYGETKAKRVNKRRAKTRVGHKKDEAIVLTAEQARLLKTQHAPTPQGIRDRLLMSLLLDLGLRASEVAELRIGYRP